MNNTILDKEIDTVSLDTQGIRMSREDQVSAVSI